MKNILFEPLEINKYYSEYLKLIKEYTNLTQNSIFIDYYNIDLELSLKHKEIKAGNLEGMVFNIFKNTPTLSLWNILNNTVNNTEVKGRMFDGSMEAVTYTIKNPNQNDLLLFRLGPHNGEDIFRVTEISTVLFAQNVSELYFNKLSTEYANITPESLNNLNINDIYYFISDKEKYLIKQAYASLIRNIEIVDESLTKENFNRRKELYVNFNNDENGFIFKTLNENRSYFTNILFPYSSIGKTIKYENIDFDKHPLLLSCENINKINNNIDLWY